MTLIDTQNIIVERKIIETKEGKLPTNFDPASLTNLFLDQFVTWNEVNRKVMTGSDDGYVRTLSKDHIMKLPRGVNGKWDVSNGTYSIEKFTFTKCKYIDEVRLCLGVAVVTPVIDGPMFARTKRITS